MSVSQGGSRKNNNRDFFKNIDARPRFNILSCFSYQGFCFLIFILFIILVLCIFISVAKTGLVQIPIISSIFYHEPQPSEIINSASDFALKDRFNIQSNGDQSVGIILTQEELTTLVANYEKFDQAQIAINDLNLELFALTKFSENKKAYLTANFIPIVKNQKLDFKITSFKIGNLKVPVLIANFSKSLLMGFWQDQLAIINNLKITKVDLKKGQLILTTLPW